MSAIEDQLDTPTWLNNDFLYKCIASDGPNSKNFLINNVKLKYVVPKGENFCSIMIRVILNGKSDDAGMNGNAIDYVNNNTEEKRLILKVAHSDEISKKAVDKLAAFPKEIDMYSNLVPKFQKLLQKGGISDLIACRCMYIDQKTDVIAMEDLNTLGYYVGDRINGVDMDCCKLVMFKLALLHGSSMRYYEINSLKGLKPFYLDHILSNADEHTADPLKPHNLTNRLNDLIDDLYLVPGYEKEVEYLKKISESFFELLLENIDYVPGNIFNAQTHGDCWTNNIMFKNDVNGKVSDVKLLDLQLSCYNSVVYDLLYFLITSANKDVLENNVEKLLQYYIDNLKSVLLKVGFKGTIPNYDQLLNEIKEKKSLILLFVAVFCCVMKNQMSEEDKSRKTDDIVKLDGLQALIQNTRRTATYQKHMFSVINLMKKLKLFE